MKTLDNMDRAWISSDNLLGPSGVSPVSAQKGICE